ncbi:MAG: D-serine ammonia-lyase [Clostridia bacterium]|nr:D-serine ammonia-lyase [Clostridia bacterium]
MMDLTQYPLIDALKAQQPVVWWNDFSCPVSTPPTEEDVSQARARLVRFAPFLKKAFPAQLAETNGRIESPLFEINNLKNELNAPGRWLLKGDHLLPVSGSIKARGGFYAVLCAAERLCLQAGLVRETDDYARFADEDVRAFLSEYTILVGSTGNLGLSVGMMGTALGFHTVVHMSMDARAWKVALLRRIGAEVVQHEGDYSLAVAQGRREAEADPKSLFIDDENSVDLFMGYAAAVMPLSEQIKALGITVDREHPLVVYLPCGVGGSPGGITLGLKQVYGDAVYPVFVEPVAAPCMTLGLMTGLHDQIESADIGLSGLTAADGLAVSRASAFVGRAVGHMVAGCATVEDDDLFRMTKRLLDSDGHFIEPSAAASLCGSLAVCLDKSAPFDVQKATHLCWATGGSMVPEGEKAVYLEKGAQLLGK